MAHRLRFGIYVPQLAFSYDDVLSRALVCEQLGYDTFWLFDHLYGPELPEMPSLEGWTLASALLARTTRLRVGHLVSCNNFRHPAVLARMATTVDHLSNGRLEFGLGSGSYEAEHQQAGLPWGSARERSERLGESLEIITRMFAGSPTSFQGRHYTVTDLPNLPGPVQQPRPPIHIGGAGPRYTLPLVARYADVWNVPTYAMSRLAEVTADLERACGDIGRDPAGIERSVQGVLVLAPADELAAARDTARRRFGGPAWSLDDAGFIGTPDQVRDQIAALAERGVTRFEFFVHDRASTRTLTLFAEEVMAPLR
jgi:alkanesulfonate monooxygenase SsuD/methylene tetrahydromethanopterin reductase-like flavin-dependent oxidoreductase (luciferase family)